MIKEDNDGNIWFATPAGVSRYDPKDDQGSFTYFTEKEGLSSNLVQVVLEDKRGNLWFGTQDQGLSRYNPKEGQESFTSFTRKNGLTNNFVCSIVEDRQGNLWVGTLNGITLLRPPPFYSIQKNNVCHICLHRKMNSQ